MSSGLPWQLAFTYEFDTPQGPFGLGIEHEWRARATGLFGPSGSGKTTLLEVLLGIRSNGRVRGSATVAGDAIFTGGHRLPPEKRPFGWVPQNSSLFPHLTVEENLRFAAPDHAWRPMAELMEVDRLLDRRPHELSGGERQRVALGRALAAGRRILLLDEPLASLDKPRRDKLRGIIRRALDETGAAMIYVSHEWDEIKELCDHALILEHGRLASHGAPDSLQPY